jgi:hypothetical protein
LMVNLLAAIPKRKLRSRYVFRRGRHTRVARRYAVSPASVRGLLVQRSIRAPGFIPGR